MKRLKYSNVLLLLALVGCSGEGLIRAGGRLTYKGEPVPSTLVTFLPDDGGRPSHGLTDDDGRFTLTYSRDQVGVSRGAHAVFLRYVVSNDEELGQAKPKASKELKAIITTYGDSERSNLHFEIKKNGQYIEIDLE
jgi:hypothetical protein